VRCACHILNLVARDDMPVISGTIENIKSTSCEEFSIAMGVAHEACCKVSVRYIKRHCT
jgi:hypothetical protein